MTRLKTILGLMLLLAFITIKAQGVLLRGPYLQMATSNSIIIRWRTDSVTQGVVKYGTSPNFGFQNIDTFKTTEHQLTLKGLVPHTKYFYSIGDSTNVLQSDTGNYFYTLPVAGTESVYRIGVFGDCGNNSINQMNVKKSFLNYIGYNYLDSWVLLGDNAYNSGTEIEFQSNFFNIYKNDLLKKFPLWTTPGNHDYDNNLEKQKSHDVPYFNVFSMPTKAEAGGVASKNKSYYSFNLGNIHLISLDSYGLEDNTLHIYDTLSPQIKWLKKDFDSNTNKGWIVVFFHHPPYTMGSHNSDVENELIKIRQNLLRILERYNVDLVMCGHSHVYERSSLMKGYYGLNKDFDSTLYDLSTSKAFYNGSTNSCPYIKDSSNKGTVYLVSGSAGQLGGTQPGFPLKAMQFSNAVDGGAVYLEVQGNRLDGKWICADGKIRDQFTMMKNVNIKPTITINEGDTANLTASYIGTYAWSDSTKKGKTIQVSPANGTFLFTVHDAYNCIKDSFNLVVKPVLDSEIVSIRAGILDKNTNEIYWQTNKELENDYFEVEYSADKIDFTTINKTISQGDGQTGKTYYYYDKNFNPSLIAFYYRIKTIFKNGKVAYSRTVRLANANTSSIIIEERDIVVAPNPASFNEMRIKLNRTISVAADLLVHDVSGRLIERKSIILTNGFQRFLPPLTAGYYIITINLLGNTINKKVIIY